MARRLLELLSCHLRAVGFYTRGLRHAIIHRRLNNRATDLLPQMFLDALSTKLPNRLRLFSLGKAVVKRRQLARAGTAKTHGDVGDLVNRDFLSKEQLNLAGRSCVRERRAKRASARTTSSGLSSQESRSLAGTAPWAGRCFTATLSMTSDQPLKIRLMPTNRPITHNPATGHRCQIMIPRAREMNP